MTPTRNSPAYPKVADQENLNAPATLDEFTLDGYGGHREVADTEEQPHVRVTT